jgi:pimeloyl-ACP methyl ester carboxylesterase
MTSQDTSIAAPTGADAGVLEQATSVDGTAIAYWRSGHGPALVLVHGTTADHTRWQGVLPLLEPHVTVYAIDRRGRGGSGDSGRYTLASEAADVAAVVDAVAASTGGPVDVLGHSYGATCALEAALLTKGIRRLVLYEAGIGAYSLPAGFVDRITGLMAQDRRAEVVTGVLQEVAGMTESQLDLARAAASWPNRVAAAHTVVRELRAHEAYRFEPERFAAWNVPTVLLAGSDSLPEDAAATALLADTLPGACVVTLQGQGHVAMLTAPDLFTREVLTFLQGWSS